ncbi:TetR family transcriptional regulator [Streptomyces agglomeratus]|uniref:TetR/AcrR family transcriptional regulator n=1 Tax=Streptomyces agglomeratus TaxID=285458 RepID=UPI00086E7C1E|nr:TetR/AcrR family transcriptional regulator [Streptomyces agglomeratus]OEJ62169.1 TetR family transcriptional regulator [Streptomyces agglomeratus]
MSDRRTLILQAATRVIARRGVRGLRVEELAAEAKVSTALIYYHFGDRAGLMRRTLEFISERAERHTEPSVSPRSDPRAHLEQMLLLELQDAPTVRENSAAWGELRATAVFEPELREQLRDSTYEWVEYAAGLIRRAQEAGTVDEDVIAADSAERLTTLVEGLSERWLSGSTSLDRARELLRGAVASELPLPGRPGPAPAPTAGDRRTGAQD